MKKISVIVSCCECGKQLRAHEGLARGAYHVRKHKRLDTGSWCRGHLWSNHRPEAGR